MVYRRGIDKDGNIAEYIMQGFLNEGLSRVFHISGAVTARYGLDWDRFKVE